MMACHVVSTKPLSEPILDYYQCKPQKHTLVNLKRILYIFIHENDFEEVIIKNGIHFSQPQYVKNDFHYLYHVCVEKLLQIYHQGPPFTNMV